MKPGEFVPLLKSVVFIVKGRVAVSLSLELAVTVICQGNSAV